ncbi:MAG: ImmA/IrrE family metallo-endopeptidase [Candidatus Competibacteraceae bacterium]|nr:ImmA/IrrE family metallo-endopeptidase [Candidatus Competibacteraceae bacterium]
MSERKAPTRWANDLTVLLNARDGHDRFPVQVEQLALDYSAQAFPTDPISLIKGDDLPGFEGALFKAPKSETGWGIFYNSSITSPGRIRFTLAHEFGHYLLHREEYPEGIECSAEDMHRWESDYRQIEQQANEFAATLLMPFDDYRRQISAIAKPNLDEIGQVADERYGVSLIAATLRWLQYTQRRAILVKSIDGFIHWARSSGPALRSGAYFKTAGRPPIEIPGTSLPVQTALLTGSKGTIEHDAGAWLKEPCVEHTLVSDRYDFALSLLHLGDAPSRHEEPDEEENDLVDRITAGFASN